MSGTTSNSEMQYRVLGSTGERVSADTFLVSFAPKQNSFLPKHFASNLKKNDVLRLMPIVLAHNAIVLTNNAIVSTDNAIVSAHNAIVSTDNAIVSAHNAIVSPNNAIVSPDNAIVSTYKNKLTLPLTLFYLKIISLPPF